MPALCQQILQFPNVIHNLRLHCGSDADRLVNPAEGVEGEVQAERSPQVMPLPGLVAILGLRAVRSVMLCRLTNWRICRDPWGFLKD